MGTLYLDPGTGNVSGASNATLGNAGIPVYQMMDSGERGA